MRQYIRRVVRWLKNAGANSSAFGMERGYLDRYRKTRRPSTSDMLSEFKNIAWTCATINSSVSASYQPRLYISTSDIQPSPKCHVRPLSRHKEATIRSDPRTPQHIAQSTQIHEVLTHPVLDLLRHANTEMSSYELLELTTLYQEIFGVAYWHIETDELDMPSQIWIIPTQCMHPVRAQRSKKPIDWYEYRVGGETIRYETDEIIAFRYPDPRNPYSSGMSPLASCFESLGLYSSYLSFKQATWDNHGVPAAVITPDEVIGEEEAERLQQRMTANFGGRNAGRPLVAESAMKVHLLSHSMGDLAALAEHGKTKEDIANAFGVPVSYITKETNLANLEAAQQQHLSLAISPRLRRRDQKLNEALLPYYDQSERLFLQAEDPVPENETHKLKQQEADLKNGVKSINEVRAERAMPPVPWGDVPWLPLAWKPTDKHTAVQTIISDSLDEPNTTGDKPPKKPQRTTTNT